MKSKVLFFLLLLGVTTVGYFSYIHTTEAPSVESVMSETDAVNEVIAKHPELAEYRTTSLPPSSIETKAATGGWYVGFIREGSGIPGVIDAECYFVGNESDVTLLGAYTREAVEVDSVNIETCEPVMAPPPAETETQEPKEEVVKPRPVPMPEPTPISSGGCYRGGCSGQLCTNDPAIVSTCEWREEYGCYKTARCERQSNGACGWTQDNELNACLMSTRGSV